MSNGIVVLGATSLVGSDFVALAGPIHPITALGRVDPRPQGLPVRAFVPVDLSDAERTRSVLAERAERTWINFAARTDVDGCESERPETPGPPAVPVRPDSAWTMNAELPGWLGELAERRGATLLHISTDFVFDGERGPYAEAELPSPFGPRVGWYGFTKGVGEARLGGPGSPHTLVRVSYPYRASFPSKTDFARNLLERARAGTLYPLYTDQRITPTWIPDVSRALLALIDRPRPGVFHIASPEVTTPYEFALHLLRAAGIDPGRIESARLSDLAPSRGRAPRPRNGGLSIERARREGYELTGAREGARRIGLGDPKA
ncbi:MAG TPA: sugar nucleotide-binding protein [Thermoplasmata archaeon]|nr:sugar nucleotide-binding protein [Thermoplasmata archaeon]